MEIEKTGCVAQPVFSIYTRLVGGIHPVCQTGLLDYQLPGAQQNTVLFNLEQVYACRQIVFAQQKFWLGGFLVVHDGSGPLQLDVSVTGDDAAYPTLTTAVNTGSAFHMVLAPEP